MHVMKLEIKLNFVENLELIWACSSYHTDCDERYHHKNLCDMQNIEIYYFFRQVGKA